VSLWILFFVHKCPNVCDRYGRQRQKQKRVNMLSHVSTSRNPLYTDVRPHPHYLTQNSSFLILTERNKSIEESKYTSAP